VAAAPVRRRYHKDELVEAVEVEGFRKGGVVAPAFGDVQVTGVFDGRDDRCTDGSQVDRPVAGAAAAVSSSNVTSRM
jgi:hypothetical protein